MILRLSIAFHIFGLGGIAGRMTSKRILDGNAPRVEDDRRGGEQRAGQRRACTYCRLRPISGSQSSVRQVVVTPEHRQSRSASSRVARRRGPARGGRPRVAAGRRCRWGAFYSNDNDKDDYHNNIINTNNTNNNKNNKTSDNLITITVLIIMIIMAIITIIIRARNVSYQIPGLSLGFVSIVGLDLVHATVKNVGTMGPRPVGWQILHNKLAG